MKALLRLYYGSIKALLQLYYSSIDSMRTLDTYWHVDTYIVDIATDVVEGRRERDTEREREREKERETGGKGGVRKSLILKRSDARKTHDTWQTQLHMSSALIEP